ncbi:sensor histidine kinase [Noviherbaspirillum malthae]|uniref:sensor histidine kinase n=1 Tax=Noviherbaspirillum malthae TaxID=1260987 RepID=UPI00188E181D|nr:ATP-binding protein [Noviherbaspirillum malthae]
MPMRHFFKNRTRSLAWLAAWLACTAGGSGWLCYSDFQAQRQLFETDSRIAHRLLTQRTVQHDTILATLAAVGAEDAKCAPSARAQIMRIYPQITAVLCSRMEPSWDATLFKAEAASRRSGHAEVAGGDFTRGRYWLVQAGERDSWALQIDMRQMVPRTEWPTAPLQVQLHDAGSSMLLQQGPLAAAAWQMDFSKHLSSDSQPFGLLIRRGLAWSDLPLAAIAIWSVLSALIVAAAYAARRQAVERRRAESLLRLRRAERLSTLGELSAGVAHELNQPLTAILANCQAARRLLDMEKSEVQAATAALGHAIAQAKRASAVINRLRSLVEQRQQEQPISPVVLGDAVRRALHLLEPELQQRHTAPVHIEESAPVTVQADPVALDQILHNLLLNALQAMDGMPVAARRLRIHIASGSVVGAAVLRIADNGPGIPAQALPRLFEPFYTTRENGLGLGLTLCETLAGNMGCAISATNGTTGGAEFSLRFSRMEEEMAA